MSKRNQPEPIILYRGDDEIELPTRFDVCPRCEGRGSHTNPNIDGNGLTADDFNDDPDFREDYFSGVYDVACERCDGQRVVAVVDESRCQPGDYEAYCAQREEAAREYESEAWLRRAESGERW